jgi:hypothetical protein
MLIPLSAIYRRSAFRPSSPLDSPKKELTWCVLIVCSTMDITTHLDGSTQANIKLLFNAGELDSSLREPPPCSSS